MQISKYKKPLMIGMIIFLIILFIVLFMIVPKEFLINRYSAMKNDLLTISTFIFGLDFTVITILIGLLDNKKIIGL